MWPSSFSQRHVVTGLLSVRENLPVSPGSGCMETLLAFSFRKPYGAL